LPSKAIFSANHTADRFGQVAAKVRHRPVKRPPLPAARDDATVAEVAQEIGDEEQVALGPRVNQGRKLWRKDVPREGKRQIVLHLGWAEEVQGDFAARAVALQFHLNWHERVGADK
jgi:hypothetical protein